MPRFATCRRMLAAAVMTVGALCGVAKASAEQEGVLTILGAEGGAGGIIDDMADLARKVRGHLKTLPFKWEEFEATDDFVAVTLPDAGQAVVLSQVLGYLTVPEAHSGRAGEFARFDVDLNPATGRIAISPTEGLRDEAADDLTLRAARVMRARLAEAEAQVYGLSDGRIAVWSAAAIDPAASGKPVRFGLHPVDDSSGGDLLAGLSKPGYTIVPSLSEDDRLWFVRDDPVISNADLATVQVVYDGMADQDVLAFTLNPVGTKKLADWTTANVGKPFAVVVDETAVAVPVVREPLIGGAMQMATGTSQAETERLAGALDPLGARIAFVVEKTCKAAQPRAPPTARLIDPETLHCN